MFFWRDKEKEQIEKIEAHYHANKAFLMAYGTKFLKSREKTEDALQETMLAIIEKKEKYVELSCTDFRRLAVVIMRRKCIDQLRKEQTYSKWTMADPPEEINGVLDVVPDSIIHQEEEKALRDAIKTLDSLNQEILQMRYVEDMSYKAISDALGLKKNLVQVRLNRAKKKLRDILREEVADER